ncbi:MAG: shikimate kinase, partial [Altererythrobacter sp.]|nr:shikimate kinase [Altererythrobacter sp.]
MTDAQPILNEERIAGIINRLNRPIALVGLMGVGKSTIGRRLANALDRAFIDADDEIEDAAQRKISEIFEQFGEDYFRDGERRVIARLIEGHDG